MVLQSPWFYKQLLDGSYDYCETRQNKINITIINFLLLFASATALEPHKLYRLCENH